MKRRRDSLGELGQVGSTDQIAQLGLADQHQLQQFVLVGVDVGEHPQLLQTFAGQVLGLVKDQDHPAARSIFGNQILLKAAEQVDIGLVRPGRLGQRQKHPAEQLAPVTMGIGNQPDPHIVAHRFQKVMQKRGLAGADVAGDQRDRRAGQDAIFQNRIGALVQGRPVEKARVRDQRKRPLAHPEEACVNIQRACHARTCQTCACHACPGSNRPIGFAPVFWPALPQPAAREHTKGLWVNKDPAVRQYPRIKGATSTQPVTKPLGLLRRPAPAGSPHGSLTRSLTRSRSGWVIGPEPPGC